MPAQTSRKTHKQPSIAHPPSQTLKCIMASAMFADERLVRVELPDGGSISAVVHKSKVTVTYEYNGIASGLLQVRVIAKSEGFVLVELPEPAINGLRELRVPEAFFHSSYSSNGDSPMKRSSISRSARDRAKHGLSVVSNLASRHETVRGKR